MPPPMLMILPNRAEFHNVGSRVLKMWPSSLRIRFSIVISNETMLWRTLFGVRFLRAPERKEPS